MDSCSLWLMLANAILCTMGFARCVTIFSNLSKMSIVFSAKKSGYVFMIAVCTDSPALQYDCARTLSSGKPVILINTDQSTRKFRNCCEVISACNCGTLAVDNCTDARALVDFDSATLLILRMERASLITDTPTGIQQKIQHTIKTDQRNNKLRKNSK